MTHLSASTRHSWTQLFVAFFVFVALVMVPDIAFATGGPGGQFTNQLSSRLMSAVDTARIFTYILAAAGIIVLAILAFFGKFSWVRLLYIVLGVILVAGAFEIIRELSGDFGSAGQRADQLNIMR